MRNGFGWHGHGDGRVPLRWKVFLVLLFAGFIVLELLSCSGESLPTAATHQVQTVSTAYGTVTAEGPISAEDVRLYVEQGYDSVSSGGYSLRAEGLNIRVVSHDPDRYGWYDVDSDTIIARQDSPAVIAHEIGHRAVCKQLGGSSECCRCVWHGCQAADSACPRGYDLSCGQVCGG